jgi:hypothetical protein
MRWAVPRHIAAVRFRLGKSHSPGRYSFADVQAFGVDVDRLEVDQLADAQSGRVGGHEQDAVLAHAGGLEQPHELLLAVDLGQLAGASPSHPQIEGGLAQHVAVKEGDGRRVSVAGARGEAAFGDQVVQVRPDLFELELVGRTPVELS